METGNKILTIPTRNLHLIQPGQISISPDGNYLVIADGNTLKIWKTKDEKLQHQLMENHINQVVF